MRIKVRVKAGARRERVRSVEANLFEIDVREPAAQHRANERVCQIIATHYRVPHKRVRLIKGHRSPSKILEIL